MQCRKHNSCSLVPHSLVEMAPEFQPSVQTVPCTGTPSQGLESGHILEPRHMLTLSPSPRGASTHFKFTISTIQCKYSQGCALLWDTGRLLSPAAHSGWLPVGGDAWAKFGIGVRSKKGTPLHCTSLFQLTPPHIPYAYQGPLMRLHNNIYQEGPGR